MNKQEFILKLSETAGLTNEECGRINDILEDNFIFSKKNKDIITEQISAELSVDMEKASDIYDCAKRIINENVKDSLKHPFRSKD